MDDFERSGVVFSGYRSSAKTEVCDWYKNNLI